MACGVPVVSSDGGALPEVVGDAGIVVPAGDSEALAGALRTLLEDKDIRSRLAEQGRARILRQFSWKLAAERLTRYYRGLISEAPSTLQSDGESARQIDRAEAA